MVGMERIKVKRLRQTAKIPTKQPDDAAWDLYFCPAESLDRHYNKTYYNEGVVRKIGENYGVEIHPTTGCTFETGISLCLPAGYHAKIEGRSGLAFKNGVVVLGGVIDNLYRGEIKVKLACFDSHLLTFIQAGDRIAQLILCKDYPSEMIEEDFDDNTSRGSSGFGSTGR